MVITAIILVLLLLVFKEPKQVKKGKKDVQEKAE